MIYFILRGKISAIPHVIIEYTTSVETDARVPELMHVLNDMLIGYADVFPISGIHACALRLSQYRMADGAEDDAFIHVTFRIKAGRRKTVAGSICAVMFAATRTHLADAFARRYLGLTLKLVEFGAHNFRVENNVHVHFTRAIEPQQGVWFSPVAGRSNPR